MIEANPNTRPWRASVTYAAKQRAPAMPLQGPIFVTVEFFFPFPKGLLKKDGTPKSKDVPWKHTKPDIDKLLRAILDGCTDAGLWRDDSQVCRVAAEKYHSAKPYCAVRVGEIAPPLPFAEE